MNGPRLKKVGFAGWMAVADAGRAGQSFTLPLQDASLSFRIV